MSKSKTAVLYSSSLCNLKCTYCYINKNKALNHIDKIIEESFNDEDYYFNFIKRYFEKGDLENLEVWGAETFLHMDRVFPTIHKLIEYYPFFNSFFASTNFSYDSWCTKVFDLLNQFALYPARRFNVCLQLSLDGPEHITDATRGKGTTQACLRNFDKLLSLTDEIPDNVHLSLAFKPTLSIDTIYLLNTKESIIQYYQFFESLLKKAYDLNSDKISINHPVPNMGVPVPAKKQDGIYFMELVKRCREIEKEDTINHYFDYYDDITPFSTNIRPRDGYSVEYPCFNCGTGSSVIGFLPNNLISACHNGFCDVVEEYEKEFIRDPNSSIDIKTFKPTKNIFTHTEETYERYEEEINLYNCNGSKCRTASLAAYIRMLAISGEIEERYTTEKGAIEGALKFQSCTCNCLRDNYQVTGSTLLPPEGMIILLLNGAIDYIMPEDDSCDNGGCNCGCC